MTLTEKIKEIVGRHGTEVGDDPEFDELASLALGIADELERGDVEYRVWYEDKKLYGNPVKCESLAYHPITNKNRQELDPLLKHYQEVIGTRTKVQIRRRGAWKTVKEFNELHMKEDEV